MECADTSALWLGRHVAHFQSGVMPPQSKKQAKGRNTRLHGSGGEVPLEWVSNRFPPRLADRKDWRKITRKVVSLEFLAG